MSRSQLDYVSQKKEDPALLKELIEIKDKHPYYGAPRVLATLHARGYHVNGKRVARLLKELNLLVPRLKKVKKSFLPARTHLPDAIHPNHVWAMDFVSDCLSNKESFRCLTIVDLFSRETPGIFAAKSMAGYSPVSFLESLKSRPKHIIVDNGPEFTSQPFISWCEKNSICLHFIDPGKPVQNAYIESFNGKFRQEFLRRNGFKSIADLRSKLAIWIYYYNNERPHSSLDYMTPKQFADAQTGVIDEKINSPVLKTG